MNRHQRPYFSDHVSVTDDGNGVSLVSCRLPSHLVADIVEMLDTMLALARWLHTRTRMADAAYRLRRFRELQNYIEGKSAHVR